MVIRIEKDQALALAALAALAGALVLPLFTTDLRLPADGWLPGTMGEQFRDWLAGAGVIPTREIYLTGILGSLFTRGEYLLLGLTAVLAILLPGASIAACAWLAFAGSPTATGGGASVRRLASATRWAMADVFLVTLAVALTATNGLGLHLSAGLGTYSFATAVVLGMLAQRATLGRIAAQPAADPRT
jgi:hypothetical protein